MFGLSAFEILFLGVLALIVIGPKELPVVARTIGRFLNDLKRSTHSMTEELKQQARIDLDDPHHPKQAQPPQQPLASPIPEGHGPESVPPSPSPPRGR